MPRTFSPAPDDADEACTKCLGRKSTKSNPMVLCDAAGCLNGVSFSSFFKHERGGG